MKKFGLLVGNGFTLDWVSQFGLHSSFPFRTFSSRNIRYNTFIHKLPAVKQTLKKLKENMDDYTAITNYIQEHWADTDKYCQLRRFLAIAYSTLQLEIDKYEIKDWKWLKWLEENRDGLVCAISLNYDVLLENVLRVAGISHYRTGTNEAIGKVPILKPHGSIDFDSSNTFIDYSPEQRWNMITAPNNVDYVHVIPKSEWLGPRMQADLIPPSVHNYQRHHTWVKSMFRQYHSTAKDLDALIIIGISYWKVDRPEINFFLENLPEHATVFIIDSAPNPDLIAKLQGLGLPYQTFGPKQLPW